VQNVFTDKHRHASTT